jgi:hypothetical protein
MLVHHQNQSTQSARCTRTVLQVAFILTLNTVVLAVTITASAAQTPPSSQPAQPAPRVVIREGETLSQKRLRIEKTAVQFRTAGITGDRSVIPAMRAALYPQGKDVETQLENRTVLAALHSLAQLGATEALPDIESAMTRSDLHYAEARYARIARARLLAEAGDKRPTPLPMPVKTDSAILLASPSALLGLVAPVPAEAVQKSTEKPQEKLSAAEKADLEAAKAKLDRYLKELSLSVEDLNQLQEMKKKYAGTSETPWVNLGLALRELADMIYLKHDVSLVNACVSAGIDFKQDSPSQLKVNLAPYTQKVRLASLIAWLSQVKVLAGYEDYVMQLVVNEGTAGSGAAAEQLRVIQKDRQKYNSPQIGGLIRIIRGVGDTEQASLVEGFAKDKEMWVVHDAKIALPDISNGTSHRGISIY